MRVNKPFSQETQETKDDLGDYLDDPEEYIRAFKGVIWLYDLTWKDVVCLGANTDSQLKFLSSVQCTQHAYPCTHRTGICT